MAWTCAPCPASTCSPRKPCGGNSAAAWPPFPRPSTSPPGWACVRTIGAAAAQCSAPTPAPRPIGSPAPCAWPRKGCPTPRTNSGDQDRRLRATRGGAAAVTAVANKLARIRYVLSTTRQPYRPELHAATGELHRARTRARLTAKLTALGSQVVPNPAAAGCCLRDDLAVWGVFARKVTK